jgi:hypothetical protein
VCVRFSYGVFNEAAAVTETNGELGRTARWRSSQCY